jgi:hypothetical protein
VRVLLDNCVDARFGKLIAGHEVVHVLAKGWDQLTNGHLLNTAEEEHFGVLLTVDKNMRFQQNFAKRKISLITIEVLKIDLASLAPFGSVVEKKLNSGIPPGSMINLSSIDLSS